MKRKRPVAVSFVLFATSFAHPTIAQSQAGSQPPPSNVEYLQYGVSLHTLTLLDSGDVCPGSDGRVPCIVGSGGGFALRMGYRARGPMYVGASFQLSRLNSANLLRLAILQRLTVDGRYYFDRGTRLTPYLHAGAGATIYGNEWGASTGGAAFGLGVGIEYQITATTVVGLLPSYQPMALRRWTDSIGQRRADGPLGFGLVHWLAVQIIIEARDPLQRW